MEKFEVKLKEHAKKLKLFVPVVDKVHGKQHPEFHDVRRVYDSLVEKIEASQAGELDLKAEFESLRKITDNYRVPEGTCESYEAVYEMLSELDRAYGK